MPRRAELIATMAKSGKTVDEVAAASGVSRSTLFRWRRGETVNPNPREVDAVAMVLHVDPAELRSRIVGSLGGPGPDNPPHPFTNQAAEELRDRLLNAATVDARTISLLAAQTESIRELDRRLGARAAEVQLQGHLAAIELLRSFGVDPKQREPLALLHSAAATLAGWQCLDLGDFTKAWQYYEIGKNSAREGRSVSGLAHAIAEQAYVLHEIGELPRAAQLMEQAHKVAGTSVAPLLRAWLWAARGELHGAAGDPAKCGRAFEAAARILPSDARDPGLPYVILSDTHLGRWRGNALAALGDVAAVDELQQALHALDPSFTRARAGMHVDLGYAFIAANAPDQAVAELRAAKALAARVSSARQRRRVHRLELALQTS